MTSYPYTIPAEKLSPRVCLCALPAMYGPQVCDGCGINEAVIDECGHVTTKPPADSYIVSALWTVGYWQ